MSEYMGLIYGQYDAKEEGFVPAAARFTTRCLRTARISTRSRKHRTQSLAPQKLSGTMAFMFESRYIIRPTKFAMDCAELQHEYSEVWHGV
jgi:homogentisate 1,2-dioxygenase